MPVPAATSASVVTREELGLDFGAWEIFQHPRFVDVYARYFGWTVLVEHGVVVFARRVPGLGILRVQAYSPEAGGGADWHRILGGLPAGRIEVMTNAPTPSSVATPVSAPDLYSFMIDLRGGANALFDNLDARTRKAIRKGERENLTVRVSDDARDLMRFHEVLLRVTGGGVLYDAPDAALLLAIMRAGFARLYVMEHGGQVVGGLVLLVNRYSHGYVSAFDRHACNGLPGHLLYWRAIQGEVEAGIPFLDLGAQRLSVHPGITKVKLGFSPHLVPAYRYELALS
ncbi:MAG: GNAT family N-acetyltransferase, partial [Steroidobacteraceae bacterium]|nr:GNAT family N-acetyltransferase [Steroidobacteraceae bacterium]